LFIILVDTDKTAKLSPSVFKECLSVLLTFILEAARTDTDSGGISSVLEDCKFAPDRIRRLQTIFAESRLQLRASLGRVRSSLPYLLDVNWRLDYYIKNNNLEKVDKPVYLISLKTEVGMNSETKQILFSCTQEQLQVTNYQMHFAYHVGWKMDQFIDRCHLGQSEASPTQVVSMMILFSVYVKCFLYRPLLG
jgi:hypothetical protein